MDGPVMKKNLSLKIANPTDNTDVTHDEPNVDVLPTPSAAEVDAALDQELHGMNFVTTCASVINVILIPDGS
jgi:hypothetical protein